MPRKKLVGSRSFGEPLTDDPDDAPEVLDEFFRTGEITQGAKVIRLGRPPLGDKPKGSVTLRLDADVLETYRALGKGWQAQLNADLRRARKLKKSA
ncbi:BrnA antitoxin family protein [Rhodopseudomonas sp. P2A-2r]|uniref:BrnA antitoxin family protein n=1 Tax=Rhodopseudomonas sp. P2A-2r TaxID=2991972 RepID=UPI0022342698|nr:BrnA antitoxin family protein [Rhodopseudomonas sp. P2A-2r]UZE50905.1 BrnA antitoxin family protein [Rhodopseudomonas sp. P2A-2r]